METLAAASPVGPTRPPVTGIMRLGDGKQIPTVGFGTYLCSPEEVTISCRLALDAGYMHIDTAEGYANEEAVGMVIKEYIDTGRAAPYITTKVFPGMNGNFKTYDQVIKACEDSLAKLQVESIDLYLIHAPFAGPGLRLEQWKAMVHLQQEGKCKSIGVSNYNIHHLQEIKDAGLPMPAANQLELHPLCQHRELVEYCKAEGILCIAYSSLAPLSNWRPEQRSGKQVLPEDQKVIQPPLIDSLALKYGVSSAQILLRWALQHEYPILPKSISPERIKANLDVFGFAIDDAEIAALDDLDSSKALAWPIGDPCMTE